MAQINDGDASFEVEAVAAAAADVTMAEETGTGNDQPETDVLKMQQKIQALEKEKEDSVDQIAKLTAKVEDMEAELDQSDETKLALESVVSRALELETQVSRLQHDLILAMNEGDEANKEVSDLKKAMGEREMKLEEVKKEKSETEKKVRGLERHIGVLEMSEMEERSKKIRIEEEMRDRISESDGEIKELKKRTVELESEVGRKEMLEERLKGSEMRVRELEGRLLVLQGHTEEAERVIAGMKEKTINALNGFGIQGGGVEIQAAKAQLPVVRLVAMGSTATAVAAASVLYLFYSRRS